MKRFLTLFLVCLLLTGLLGSIPVSAAEGKLSVTASSTNVTVGQNVTVTLTYDGNGNPIGGAIGSLSFNTEAFSYVSFSGTGVEVHGGAGKMRFVYYATGAEAPTSLTVSFTFKANAPGSCDFTAATEEFFHDDDYSSLGAPSGSVTVTANNPTLSGNADLKSLVPSKGSLSPKFDPDVTEYTIAVSHSVTSLSLSATPDHSAAKTYISGKNALEVGKNTRTITVTAPNGTTKKYTVVITRAAAPTTRPTTSGTATKPTGTTTTIPTPPEDALEVEVGGNPMTILDTQAPVDLPDGFKWSTITINLVEVPAIVNDKTGMTLLYLTSATQTDNGLYIYLKEEDSFQRYRPMDVQAEGYLIYDLPTDQPAPNGVVAGTMLYDNHYVNVYVYEDPALSDFCIVWAVPAEGEAGWYTYDKKEETLQRYHATPAEIEEENASSTTKKSTRITAKTTTAKTTAAKKTISLGALLADNRRVLLIGGIAIGCVMAATLLLILILSLSRRRGKH